MILDQIPLLELKKLFRQRCLITSTHRSMTSSLYRLFPTPNSSYSATCREFDHHSLSRSCDRWRIESLDHWIKRIRIVILFHLNPLLTPCWSLAHTMAVFSRLASTLATAYASQACIYRSLDWICLNRWLLSLSQCPQWYLFPNKTTSISMCAAQLVGSQPLAYLCMVLL